MAGSHDRRTVKIARLVLTARAAGGGGSALRQSTRIIITAFQRQQESTEPGGSPFSKHCHNFIFPSTFQALPFWVFHIDFPPAPPNSTGGTAAGASTQKKHDDGSPSRLLSSTQGGWGLRGVSCDGTLGELPCSQVSNYY